MNYLVINGINPFDKRNQIIKVDSFDIKHINNLKKTIIEVYSQNALSVPYMKEELGLIIEYQDYKALSYIIDCFIDNSKIDNEQFKSLVFKSYIDSTGWTSRLILSEIEKKNIPWSVLGHHDHSIFTKDNEGAYFYYLVLGFGRNQRRMQQSITDATSDHAVQIATNKSTCKTFLSYLSIPTPKWRMISNRGSLINFFNNINNSGVVIKPNEGGGGVDCYVNLRHKQDVLCAYEKCSKNNKNILVEEFIEGKDIRLCVIDYKVICALSRTPATIIGDGVSTVSELIHSLEKKYQQNPSCRSKIIIDDELNRILSSVACDLDTVLDPGEMMPLQLKSNISSGAHVTDVTGEIDIILCRYAEKICRYIKLNVAAVDCIITQDGQPYIIEVNACPGLDNHMCPNKGKSYNFAKVIADGFFKNGDIFRIPLIHVNDSKCLFGPFQSKSYSDTLIKLQDPGLEYLIFNIHDFWEKGLPVNQLDMMIFFNAYNIMMLNFIDNDTIIVFTSFELFQDTMKCLPHLNKFRKKYFIMNNHVYDSNSINLFYLGNMTDILRLIPQDRLAQYKLSPSIIVHKGFNDAAN